MQPANGRRDHRDDAAAAQPHRRASANATGKTARRISTSSITRRETADSGRRTSSGGTNDGRCGPTSARSSSAHRPQSPRRPPAIERMSAGAPGRATTPQIASAATAASGIANRPTVRPTCARADRRRRTPPRRRRDVVQQARHRGHSTDEESGRRHLFAPEAPRRRVRRRAGGGHRLRRRGTAPPGHPSARAAGRWSRRRRASASRTDARRTPM